MIAYSSPAAVLAVSIVLTLLCLALVGLRFVAQWRQKTAPKADDYLCLASAVLTVGMAAAIVTGVAHRSLAYATPPRSQYEEDQSIEVEKIEWTVQLIQALQLGFTKLSFVVLFRRIFVTNPKSAFSVATWVMISLLIGWTTSFFFAFLFACRGNFAQWWLAPQTCIGLDFENAFALSDTLMDFLIIIMPLPMIWTLHMNLNRKIAVTTIFALGALAVIISIVRLVIFYQAKAVALLPTTDHDQLITLIVFWSLIESAVGLIAACLPLVYGLVGHRFIDSIVRSVHSLRSLASRGSSAHRSEHGSTNHRSHAKSAADDGTGHRGSDASRAPIVLPYIQPSSVMTVAETDHSGSHAAEPVQAGQIRVANDISQTDSPR